MSEFFDRLPATDAHSQHPAAVGDAGASGTERRRSRCDDPDDPASPTAPTSSPSPQPHHVGDESFSSLGRCARSASAAVRSCFLAGLPDRNSDKTEAEVAESERRRVLVLERRPAEVAGGAPAAPPDHSVLAVRGVSPLPHVAVHVA